jgi:carboxyl-terminal processing protease
MDEVWDRYQNGEALYADSNKIENGKEFKTVCGDVVYGGGGIMPNIFVPIDTSSFPVKLNRLFVNGTINSFVYQWYLKNKPQIDKYSSASEFAIHFNQADAMWSDFVSYTNKDSVNLGGISASQKEFLQNRLQANLARFRWRNYGYFQVLNNDDQLLKKAIEQIKNKSGL